MAEAVGDFKEKGGISKKERKIRLEVITISKRDEGLQAVIPGRVQLDLELSNLEDNADALAGPRMEALSQIGSR